MEADGVPPGPDEPVPAGIVHKGAHTRVARLVVPGGRSPLGFVNLVLTEEPIEGLLLVGAYRDGATRMHHLTIVVSSAVPAGGD
jgi:hypothetical protein